MVAIQNFGTFYMFFLKEVSTRTPLNNFPTGVTHVAIFNIQFNLFTTTTHYKVKVGVIEGLVLNRVMYPPYPNFPVMTGDQTH